MEKERCEHRWGMANVLNGYIITEKCFHCDKVSTSFISQIKPALEEYRDGEHFWNVMESAQSFRFDLQCGKCGFLVPFGELMGLMMCTGCDETCEVDILRRQLEPMRQWVYVAFGFLPRNERKQPTKEKIQIIEDYFNARRRSTNSRVKPRSRWM